MQLVIAIEALTDAQKTTPAALAPAWVRIRGEHVVTIPGTTKAARVEENSQALHVSLSAQQLAQLDAIVPPRLGQRCSGQHASCNTPCCGCVAAQHDVAT